MGTVNITTPVVVSEGTLRTPDLLKAFADTLNDHVLYFLNEDGGANYEYDLVLRSIGEAWALAWALDGYAQEEPVLLRGNELVNVLQGWLENLAPDGMYFGTAEGDAACFGFFYMEPEPSVNQSDPDPESGPPRVQTLLDLSTGHISPDTRNQLELPGSPLSWRSEYGYVLPVLDEAGMVNWCNGLSPLAKGQLYDVIRYAREMGVDYVKFDVDASRVVGLPWYGDAEVASS